MITPKPFSKFAPAPGNTYVQSQGLRGVDSSIVYSGSTCQRYDANGLCVADVWLGDPSNQLPVDTGGSDAVSQWVAEQQAQQNSAVLNAQIQPQAQSQSGVCGALGVPCPTNIPAPFKLNSGFALLLVLGVAAVVIAGVKK